ncbi:MAG: chemotaxis protein CheW [Desulfuromonadales bacterium]|nr:chemotaxis protein CheW [Desulfuromonadales bacterium]MDT8422175.1 chemotaxis protein CheW [Desulfuromonadales bacterium]
MSTFPQNEQIDSQEVQLACFHVGAEIYALDIMRIREIIRPQRLTPVPKAPAFIEGVINLRSAVIPIIDLRKRFDQPVRENSRKTRIIICSLTGRIIGLIVDEVLEVCRYTRSEIQPAPHYLSGRGADFFLGVCRRSDDLVMLLDLEKILTSNEKINLELINDHSVVS